MKGNDDVLALLADLLAHELTAVNQYLLHAEKCANWGYERLANKLREEADGERQHATMLIERILFLDGTPDLGRYHAIRDGGTVKELLERDLELELEAIAALEAAIARCRDCGDNASEDLLVGIVTAEQEDTQWIESQLELVRQVGEQNYLAQQLR
jgi:bacterioferritin